MTQEKTKLGKTLIANWVEERAVTNYDNDIDMKKVLRSGHKGILTTKADTHLESETTVKASYKRPEMAKVRQIGCKLESEQRELYEKFSKEVHEDFNRPPTPPDYTTTFNANYHKDYTPVQRKPTKEHSLYDEEAVSLWTANRGKIHGESQSIGQQASFRKNAAFSTPITEYQNQSLPHKIQNW